MPLTPDWQPNGAGFDPALFIGELERVALSIDKQRNNFVAPIVAGTLQFIIAAAKRASLSKGETQQPNPPEAR